MAEETLDAAVKSHGLSAESCKTVGLMLEGAKGWTPTLYIRLVQDYGLEQEVSGTATERPTGGGTPQGLKLNESQDDMRVETCSFRPDLQYNTS